jgi:hypothetical protein
MRKQAFMVMLFTFCAWAGFSGDKASHAVTLSVGEVCMIGLNSTAGIALHTNPGTAGGVPPTGSMDSSKSLWYTSVVPHGGTRRITANWGATDQAPNGTSLHVRVTSMPSQSGTAADQIRLGSEPRDIITGIGSCATGADAVKLLYTFTIDDVSGLIQGETRTVVVNFTLSDAS